MSRGRPATPPGTYGEVTATRLPSGRYQANLRIRLLDGQTRQIRKNGRSKSEAVRRAKEAAAAATTTRDGDDLTTTATITALVAYYLDHLDGRADGTLRTYRAAKRNHIDPGIGLLRLNETTTGKLDRFLSSLTPGTRKSCKALLSGAFSLAVRYDLVAHNPVRDTASPATEATDDIRAMTDDELRTFRRMVQWFTIAPGAGPNPRAVALPRLVDFLLGTGARVSDALRVRWEDIDLSGDVPRVTIHDVKKGGRPRVLEMADLAAAAVEAQRRATRQVYPWVFPTGTGRPLSVSNAERWIRGARERWEERPKEQQQDRDVDVTWAAYHALRKTVATRLADRVSLSAASQQLGHSDTTVTEHHYIQRPKQGPEVARALNESLSGALQCTENAQVIVPSRE